MPYIKISPKSVKFISVVLVALVFSSFFVTNAQKSSNSNVSTDQANNTNVLNYGGGVGKLEPLQVRLNQRITIRGWAVDLRNQIPAKEVEIIDNGKKLPLKIKVNIKRPTIAAYYKNKNLLMSGWRIALDARQLGVGKHTLEFKAIFQDNQVAPLWLNKGVKNIVTVTK